MRMTMLIMTWLNITQSDRNSLISSINFDRSAWVSGPSYNIHPKPVPNSALRSESNILDVEPEKEKVFYGDSG